MGKIFSTITAEVSRLVHQLVSTHKELPVFLIIIGIGAIIVSVGADLIGIGAQAGFGPKQIMVFIAGIGALLAGIVMKLIAGERYQFNWSGLISLDRSHLVKLPFVGLQLGLLIFLIYQIKINELELYDIAILAFFAVIIYYFLSVSNRQKPLQVGKGMQRTIQDQLDHFKAIGIIGVMLVGLYLIGIPGIYSQFGLKFQEYLYNIRNPQLSQKEVQAMHRGYYENLTNINWFSSDLAVENLAPAEWFVPFEKTKAGRLTGDFLKLALVPSSEILYHGAPFHTNRWGMRDREYEQKKPPSTYRIAMLGPSQAMGFGVADDETFEWVLEDRLNDENMGGRYSNIEILNFAVNAYTPLHQLLLLERVISFEPDAVFFIAGYDIGFTSWHLAEMVEEGIEIPFKEVNEMIIKAGVTEGMTAHQANALIKPIGHEIVAWSYTEILEQFREQDVLAIWIFVPIVEDQDYLYLEGEEITRIASETGFYVENLSDIYEGQDPRLLWNAEWDHHPNAQGNQLIAERLYEELWEGENILAFTLSGEE